MLIVPCCSSASSSGGTHAQHTARPPALHVKDVAQDVAGDVAEGVWGAEKDGSLTVLFVARAIFKRRETPKHTRAAPHAALGRNVKDEHVKNACRRPRCT